MNLSKEQQTLEKEISAFRRLPEEQQVNHWFSKIIDNPNGLAKRVVDAFNTSNPRISAQLTQRIDAETGLLTEKKFRERIKQEIQMREYKNNLGQQVMPGTYALIIPEDFEKVKAHIMQNDVLPTRRTLGLVDGVMAVFFPCDYATAQKITGKYATSTVLVSYKTGMTFEQMHEEAVIGMLPTLKRKREHYWALMDDQILIVANTITRGKDANGVITHHYEQKRKHELECDKIVKIYEPMKEKYAPKPSKTPSIPALVA